MRYDWVAVVAVVALLLVILLLFGWITPHAA